MIINELNYSRMCDSYTWICLPKRPITTGRYQVEMQQKKYKVLTLRWFQLINNSIQSVVKRFTQSIYQFNYFLLNPIKTYNKLLDEQRLLAITIRIFLVNCFPIHLLVTDKVLWSPLINIIIIFLARAWL